MSKIKIKAFLSVPICSGRVSLSKLLKEIQAEYGDKVEVNIHKGRSEPFQEYNLTVAPALVVGDLVRIMGVCPSTETLVSALRECGLE